MVNNLISKVNKVVMTVIKQQIQIMINKNR